MWRVCGVTDRTTSRAEHTDGHNGLALFWQRVYVPWQRVLYSAFITDATDAKQRPDFDSVHHNIKNCRTENCTKQEALPGGYKRQTWFLRLSTHTAAGDFDLRRLPRVPTYVPGGAGMYHSPHRPTRDTRRAVISL